MQTGFLSAILPELSLEEVLSYAGSQRFQCVELMCWPPGKAERRYAGVTHIDVTALDSTEITRIQNLLKRENLSIGAMGYYPNPLDSEPERNGIEHLKKVMTGASQLGVKVVSTFAGRDPSKTIEENWPQFEAIFGDLVAHAEKVDVALALENCPMLFSNDEWPGGKNLAISPAVWRRIFAAFPSRHLGLCFDPSHLIWQHIDILRCLREFGDRIVHVHAKDTRVDPDRLYEEGVMGLGWHTPKLPGLGDVDWGAFFSVLSDTGYQGPVCIEVEDRAYEHSLEGRKSALEQSKRFLEQFIS